MKEENKTLSQNNLFHSLLGCYWASGCSSFTSYESMRNYYKRVAGLIKVRNESTLSEETKQILYKAIKILPISQDDKITIYNYLRGRVETIESWSDVSKEKARQTLDQLLNDMDESGVMGSKMGKKYQEILQGIENESIS